MTIRTEDGREVLEDGERLSINMMLMDAQQRTVATRAILANDAAIGHRPGSLPLTDTERARRTALYRDHDKRLGERWKNPLPTVSKPDATQLTGDARMDAYAHYQDQITNAWRHR